MTRATYLSIWFRRHTFNPLNPIHIRLGELRRARGLTQVQLAERTGIDQAAISRIENGQTQGMDFSVLERLCAALDCEPGDLLERVKQPSTARRKRSR